MARWRVSSRRATALALGLALVAAACSDTGGDGASASAGGEPAEASTTTVTFRTAPTVDQEVPTAFVDLDLEDKIDAFLESPNSALASNIAADMALDGDPRWGPWLIDLLRLGPSNITDEQVAGALALISGIERPPEQFINDDYRIYGQWVYDQAVDPGPGYREWKTALYTPIDDQYPMLLGSVTDDLLLSRIQWGGVPRGGIPELNDPARVAAADADWMEPDEVVFGTVMNGEAVAYPFRVLGHHELANDTIGGTPISLVFCTLCRTALLFDRRVDGQVLDFQTSGLLVSSNKIMVDNQTDTLWSHLQATGIGGPLEGTVLEQFPLETTTWAAWTEAHPDTEVLDIPSAIFSDNPEQPPIAYDYDADSAYRFYYDDPNVWFPILDTPTDDIELKESVVGLDLGGEQLAITVAGIVANGPRVFEVGGQQVLVVPTSEAGVRVYDASGTGLAEGDEPTIAESGQESVTLDDGTTLERMVAEQGLWFAWFGNHTETDWWPRPS